MIQPLVWFLLVIVLLAISHYTGRKFGFSEGWQSALTKVSLEASKKTIEINQEIVEVQYEAAKKFKEASKNEECSSYYSYSIPTKCLLD